MSEILLDYADKQRLAEGDNKLSELLEVALGAYVVGEASGSVASFNDGADGVPVKSMIVNIVPKQEGSGAPAPDNIRNIVPIDGGNIYVSPTANAENGESIYVPFSRESKPVYGGTWDVINGELNSKFGIIAFGAGAAFSIQRVDDERALIMFSAAIETTMENYSKEYACNMFGTDTARTNTSTVGSYFFSNRFRARCPADWGATAESIAEKLALNPVVFAYPLAENHISEVKPVAVKTYAGANNIWCDCGPCSVEYRADTKLYIDGRANRGIVENKTDVKIDKYAISEDASGEVNE